MDDLDTSIISELRADARTPVATLAKRLRLSRATVQNRMTRLETNGVIVGYTVKLRPDAQPSRIRAWMTISVEGNREREVVRVLRGNPNVETLHSTNGRWDLVAELHAPSLEAFDQVLEKIRKIDGVGKTETSILLSTHR